MNKFDEFKKAFELKYDDVYEFMNEYDYKDVLPFGLKEEEDLDEVRHDSYGNENSILKRIFFSKEFDIFIQFEGTRQSYSGEDWNDYKQVQKTEKIINIWQ